MFGGINFKHLSERINESLHDLESTLSQAAALPATGPTGTGSQQGTPTRQQPTRSSTSPAAGASAASPSRARPRPAIDTQARSQSASSSSSTPLSPTSLAQASQSASQLADSALSSLRASLRKGRQSLETAAAARTSLDKSAPLATPPPAPTRAATEDSPQDTKEPLSEKAEATAEKGTEPPAPSTTSAADPATGEPEASESFDAKVDEPATDDPPASSFDDAALAAGPTKTPDKEEDLLRSLKHESAPTGNDDEASKPDLATTAAPAGSLSPTDQPQEEDADSAPAPLSTGDNETPVPFVAVCPPAPASHTSSTSLPLPPADEPVDEADDADDWGMGSISPAPDTEGFVDPPRTTKTSVEPNLREPEIAAGSSVPVVQEPDATGPSAEEALAVPAHAEQSPAQAVEGTPTSPEPAVVEAEDAQSVVPASSIGDVAADSETAAAEDAPASPPAGDSASSPPAATLIDASDERVEAQEQRAADPADDLPYEPTAPAAEAASPLDGAPSETTDEPIEAPAGIAIGDTAAPEAGTAVLPAVEAATVAAADTASEPEMATLPDLSNKSAAGTAEVIDTAGEADRKQPGAEKVTPSTGALVPPATAAIDDEQAAVDEPPVSTEMAELPTQEAPAPSEQRVEEPVKPAEILNKQAIDDVQEAVDEPSVSADVAELPTQEAPAPSEQPVEEPVKPVEALDDQAAEAGVEPPPTNAPGVEDSSRESPLSVADSTVASNVIPSSPPQRASKADEVVDETPDETAEEKADEKVELATSRERRKPEETPGDVVPGQVHAGQLQEAVVPNIPLGEPTKAADPASADTSAAAHASTADATPPAALSGYKFALGRILAAVTPLSDADDLEAVERELGKLKAKADLGMQEITRLTSQLDRRKAAFEELRETHRLEHKSQQDEIDSLRAQVAAKDAKLAAAETAAEQTRTEVAKAAEDYEKLKVVAKEEEEKRVKALSLLRALRQKLVKNEKEKEEADKVLEQIRASEAQAQDTIKADRARFDSEIVALRGAQEQQVNKLKQSFERETANLKAQYERDAASRKAQAELATITTRAEHAKELAARDARIQQLEATVRELSTARDATFEQLQQRQAEVESNSSLQEALKTRAAELEYEASEARDRVTALQEELEEVRRRRGDATRDEGTTRRLLEEAEARHSARVRDLEARARQLEKDRRETEDEMGRNLQDRLREVERLRAALAKKDVDYAESVQNTQKREKEIEAAQKARVDLEKRLKAVETSLETLREEAIRAQQAEAAAKEELSDRLQRATELEARLEEVSTRESALRSNNKTLRDELRKLQSGMLNSEKQRPAGVGYFSTMSQASTPGLTRSNLSSTSIASMSTIGGGPISPPLSASSVTSPPASIAGTVSSINGTGLSATARADGNAEEALSYEYLRNVILQFLEKPEMRSHLVQVLSVILRFTPAEQRRLAAKSATH